MRIEAPMHPMWLACALACACVRDGDAGECSAAIWARPERTGAALEVVGEWDDWTAAVPMHAKSDGWHVALLDLPPGDHGYLVVEDGEGRLDRYEGLTTFREGDALEVSLLRVSDCARPSLVVDESAVAGADVTVSLHVVPAQGDARIDRESLRARIGDTVVEVATADDGNLLAHAANLPRGRHELVVEATDDDGIALAPARAIAWIDPLAPTREDAIVYQIMIDRFRGDGGAVLAPPSDPGARAGGTLDGVRTEIERGTFEALGVSTLWLSPVYLVTDELRPGVDDEHLYAGYHGYWPLDATAVDPRIGGEDALHAVIDAAHARGIAVLLDVVPNHVDEDNPLYVQHRADAWFHEHDPPCVCGTASCPWGEYIESCWFATYLPDLRFENADAMDRVVGDALLWHERFALDGFRIDAVPMMPRATSRRIVDAVRRRAAPAASDMTIGEIFTGAGEGGIEILRWYLGPDGLDGAFDFPLMWALRDALAGETAGLDQVEAIVSYAETALDGSGSLLARTIGNHDVVRFVSAASGDDGRDPWLDPPPQPVDDDVYARTRLALSLVLALPGVPVLFQGDEMGLAGSADPDNRRVHPDLATLSEARARMLADVQRLGTLRRCSEALRRGQRRSAWVDADRWAFVRDAGDGNPAVVLANRAATEAVVPFAAGAAGVVPGWYEDAATGERFELALGATEVPVQARGLRVLLSEDDPCG